MDKFSLADNTTLSASKDGLCADEKFKTRMLRIDQPLRQHSRDPLSHYLRKGLRRLWFYVHSSKLRSADEEKAKKGPSSKALASWERSYQNTARLAEIVTRFSIAFLAGGSLIGPLAVLSQLQTQESRLTIVAVCITVFCLVVSLLSKASNHEAVAASAAYAAVLSVFVSNSAGS